MANIFKRYRNGKRTFAQIDLNDSTNLLVYDILLTQIKLHCLFDFEGQWGFL